MQANQEAARYFGNVKPANLKRIALTAALPATRTARARSPSASAAAIRSRPFGSERQAAAFIKAGIAKGTVVNADEGRQAEINRRRDGPR
ncbi:MULTISPECIES: hypothetical protein [Bradyrhizobium]|jgi:hypothetical protein|uniref:Uncharacterized protein n=2 Tax=Nitrobacteraceae TaxID=41294 RepID=A0ABV4EV43_BRAEL|nr:MULTISPECIES: hypothetical protein [Bradyrhizobium]MCP1755720.1 hypothetical protein [Bradyrhizobium elkanii]MCP1981236.1 hypothetical protein [Bradyrhizobium elkanii]MCS3452276.1 hypothetical protein [Bradyrhizobium elkanii]MCS3565621.1 hypothetical protein [Bradyrhizobium elkanii]MCS3579990.1 hypothetical protein [Bradyrhizobium elkanii]